MAKKVPVKRGCLKVKVYPILCDCVELGVRYGWNRAHKHTDKPGEDAILQEIEQAVLNSIFEYFEAEEPDE